MIMYFEIVIRLKNEIVTYDTFYYNIIKRNEDCVSINVFSLSEDLYYKVKMYP